LALTLFGVGLSAFVGKPFESVSLHSQGVVEIPLLSQIPVLGAVLFKHHFLVYVSWALFAGVSWFLYKSRAGLVLRSVGESPESAHAIGYPVVRIRYLATLFGGAMAGLGGAHLAEFYTPMWVEGMVAGRGWIALALVVFATWRPARVMVGAYLFGGVTIAQFFAQGAGVDVTPQFLSALPYLATIIVLVAISRTRGVAGSAAPASLGLAFVPDR
jgi:general nucleoside transport system permease protein